MIQKLALLMLLTFQAAFGLSAPYLYTADSVGVGKVQLTWRNNATDYLGIVVLRKPGLTAQFAAVDTAAGTATTFTDAAVPGSATPYVYALTAYSQTAHADTSNTDTVTMTVAMVGDIFVAPKILEVFPSLVNFYDSSTTETGYRIFRSTNFGAFSLAKDTVSLTPSNRGGITYIDTAVSPNTWYEYYVAAYKTQPNVSLASDTVSVFTFDSNAIKEDAFKVSREYLVLTKTGSFPIKYKGWGLKAGDTIVLNEIGLPDSTMFSIINISNPAAPKYAGTGSSPAALMGKTSFSMGRNIFGFGITPPIVMTGFEYHSGVIDKADTANLALMSVSPTSGLLSDSSFLVVGLQNIPITGWLVAREYSYSEKTKTLSLVNGVDLAGPQIGASGSVIYNRVLFTNASLFGAGGPYLPIADFRYQGNVVPSYTLIGVQVNLKNFPHIVNGMLIDTSKLKDANNIFVDTVKNLVIGLSDTELSVWTYRAVIGVANGLPARSVSGGSMRILAGRDNAAAVISLPRHSGAAAVSIYDLAGREIQGFDNVRGDAVRWVPKRGAGVYVVKALIDNRLYTARFVLSR